jgi:3',5'-cyclic AMP phosphodiesterase CpdA
LKSIVHISDLHFGTEDRNIYEALLGDIDGVTAPKPTLVAISGDLTQRARATQFQAARHFLDNLLVPYVVVPGNHDIPLFDVFRRFLKPLDLYKQYITDDLCPVYKEDDLAVMGINTAHGFTTKHGRITRQMCDRICATLGGSAAPWKVLVAHHPFVIPSGVQESPLVGAETAIPQLEKCGVDVILTGHMHVAYASDVAGYRNDEHTLITVNAGTAVSTRTRGEPNGYNRLVFDGDMLTVFHRVWHEGRFIDGPSKTYRRVVRANELEIDKVAQTTTPAFA